MLLELKRICSLCEKMSKPVLLKYKAEDAIIYSQNSKQATSFFFV